jgi:predicted MFS family arabinose efflux permease
MLRGSLSPLVIICLAGLSSAMANRAMDPLVSELARDFNVTVAVAAGVISIYALPYALSQPVLGPLGDYYGKGRLLRICMWLQCASLAVVIISPSIGILMVARFFGGIAGGGIMPSSMAAIGDRYPPQERQQKIGTFVSVALVGYTFSTAAAGILAQYLSWRTIFIITLVLCIGAAMLLSRVVETTPKPEKPMQLSDAVAGYKILFSNPRAKLCYGAVFLEGVALWGTLPYISPILEQRGQGGPGEAGLIITGMGLGGLLFTATVKHWLKFLTPYQLMFIGGFLNAVGPLVLIFDLGWYWLAAAFFVAGFGFMMVHNSIQAEVAALAPSVRGSAFSMHSCSLFIGHSLGPMVFTIGLAAIGEASILAIYAAILLVIGPAVSILFARTKPSADR